MLDQISNPLNSQLTDINKMIAQFATNVQEEQDAFIFNTIYRYVNSEEAKTDRHWVDTGKYKIVPKKLIMDALNAYYTEHHDQWMASFDVVIEKDGLYSFIKEDEPKWKKRSVK